MLDEHTHAESQILKHFVLQSSWLPPQRIPERARAAPQQIKFALPIQFVPLHQQRFARAQLSFPLLPPIGAQTARHEYANECDQPEPKTKARCARRISHRFYSCLSAR